MPNSLISRVFTMRVRCRLHRSRLTCSLGRKRLWLAGPRWWTMRHAAG